MQPAESCCATVQPNADRRQQEDSLNITSPSQHLVSFTLFLRSCHEVVQGLGGRLVVRQAKVGFCNYIQPARFKKLNAKRNRLSPSQCNTLEPVAYNHLPTPSKGRLTLTDGQKQTHICHLASHVHVHPISLLLDKSFL